ncbi:alpha/beta fold hydrolase [Kineosporia succinea]|uniref:Pimeloyl-ACP methyl ester carboxylesterase n=1 Tax=Kineosporia succinea TaxID=84632 RepID=A0ABT9P059_9ACTN|nr:alpha/beta hydrolase [Kineosporia succinea]MDP9826060.1 pimeloyl-ACP methyl ester carboxylesterase [Kineosporia succinea]
MRLRRARDESAEPSPAPTHSLEPAGALYVDSADTLIRGPWTHRFVAANGARFHVAEAGEGPLVLLLHGFPQFWWSWRHQIPALAEAGYRAVALDLRGYGASDKPPRGYDTMTSATDIAGVIKALGETQAVIVGQDWGGWLAWSMPGLAPEQTRAVASLAMGHPLVMRRALTRDARQRRAWRRVLEFQLPMRPERRLTRDDLVGDVLNDWSAAGGDFPDEECLDVYRRAIRVPFVAHSAMEYFRWALRSLPRRDGRRFTTSVDEPITVPTLSLHGEDDPFVLLPSVLASHRQVTGPLTFELLRGAGHFLPEEAPDRVTDALLNWLKGL